ncbi:MAG: hypothetical protein K2V38_11000, partial [Gemmataceae bacterium]|nr:hypothetical protein [Gemmataceae bacterium]
MHRLRPLTLFAVAPLALGVSCGLGCFTARPSGPDWFYNAAARNLTEKPVANADERKFRHRLEKAADAAWEQACRPGPHSEHYADGFREGFVDYVEAGGAGGPPYLPPFRYRL